MAESDPTAGAFELIALAGAAASRRKRPRTHAEGAEPCYPHGRGCLGTLFYKCTKGCHVCRDAVELGLVEVETASEAGQ